MIALLLLVTTILVVYFVQNKSKENTYKNFYKNPQHVWIPIIGHTYLFFRTNILTTVQNTAKSLGLTFIMYIPHRTYVTAKPEDFKIILNHPNCLNKSKEYNHLLLTVGKSLLLVKANQWKKQRKILSRAFKPAILESFVDTFYEKSGVMVDILKKEKDDENLDICNLFQKLTLDTFSEATLGVKSTILQEKEHSFVTAVKYVQMLCFDRIANLIKMSDFLFKFTSDYRSIQYHMKKAGKYISQIVDDKESFMNNNKDEMLNENRLPVLDLLVHVSEKENLTKEYIIEEMFLFAGAATDTTAYTMAYTCFLLALHPEIQEKLYQEIISVCGYGDIENSQLNNLKYLEMVISESQRLLPAIPMIGRCTTADIDLGDSIIPNNTNIILNFLTTYRNPDIYPDPMVFNPDRFLPKEIAKRPQYSFLPFSGGPRNCIGLKYAIMVMKCAIANIVRHFHITTTHKSWQDVEFESSIVMVPTVPLNIKYTDRQKN